MMWFVSLLVLAKSLTRKSNIGRWLTIMFGLATYLLLRLIRYKVYCHLTFVEVFNAPNSNTF